MENKDSIKIACATVDQKSLINDHFGEAKYFMIYKLTPGGWELIRTIQNRTAGEEERRGHGHGHRHGYSPGEHHGHGHGEEAKAGFILEHFRADQVDVFLSRRFGPNIVKIKEYVLPVVIRGVETVEDALSLCREHYQDLVKQLNITPHERKHLVLP